MPRKLTEKEQKRIERFNEKALKLQSEGYSMKLITTDLVTANIMAFVIMLPFVAAAAGLFYLAGGSFYWPDMPEFLLLFLLMIVSMPVHEGIHGITWGLFAENGLKDIEYGIIWEMITPYCTCASSLKKSSYIIGSAMPALILGMLVSVIAICTGSFFILLLGCYNIISGGGDFNIIIRLLKYKNKNKDVLFMDHPKELGLAVFEKA